VTIALNDRLIPIHEVSAITGIPHTSIYDLVRAARAGTGTFPCPIKLGPRRNRWRESAVLAWLADQEATSKRA
jgi:predicted DNA-binding transcriptional regulator AlpA